MSALAAARQYLDRKARAEHPRGTFDGQRRWAPDAGERQACCRGIRPPSAAYPFSLMVHCRTKEHVAALHGLGVMQLVSALYVLTHWPTAAPAIMEAVTLAERLAGARIETSAVQRIARRIVEGGVTA